jgi:GNAT superfamily N-acetyltransferase
VLLRSATREDSLAVAQVHVRSWQVAYRDLLPAEYLDQLRPEDRAKRYELGAADPSKPSTIVAVEGGVIVGFATVAPARDHDARSSGELCALHVDPEQWGQNIGRALIHQARCSLIKLGFHDAVLWVMMGNTRAARFYGRDGWEPDGFRRTASVWGTSVDEIRYRRPLAI